MNEREVVIFVPAEDGGFASGGGPWPLDVIMNVGYFIDTCIRWISNPIVSYTERREIRKSWKMQEEENVRLGKNRDGSFARSFPASTTLQDALTILGLDVIAASAMCESTVNQLGLKQLGELSTEEISHAVLECQISNG